MAGPNGGPPSPPALPRVALVTGSTTGIGLGIARALSASGMFVILNSRSSVSAGQALTEEMPNTLYVRADVADPTQAAQLVDAAISWQGRLDVVVNNAGMSRVIPHIDLAAATPAIWRELYDVNVIAPWQVCTAAVPALQASGRGCIINISSHAGVRPKGASIPYAVSKAALNHMTRLLALTLGPEIRVNAVAPGLVRTSLTTGWTEVHELWETTSPMRRAATVEDVAQLVLATIQSTYLTGEIITLDGGLNLR